MWVITVYRGAVAGQRSHTSGYTYKVATAGGAGAAVAVGMAAAASGGGTTAFPRRCFPAPPHVASNAVTYSVAYCRLLSVTA